MTKRNERTSVLLNLMDAPRTSFRWNENDENVAAALPSVFDAWISEYVENITDVDRAEWEVFDRWEIINVCIKEGVLRLEWSEEKASIVEVESEAFSSSENTIEAASEAG